MSYTATVFNKKKGDFRCYNSEQWAVAIEEWRKELLCGLDYEEEAALMEELEVFKLTHGEECYFTKTPSDI
jgi:hypothetical protein